MRSNIQLFKALSIVLVSASLCTQLYARTSESFDKGWLFARFGDTPAGKVDEPANLETPNLDDSSWRKLNVPHDWGIETDFIESEENSTGKLMFYGIGWYRKHFFVPESDNGKSFFIQFDGVMSHPTIYLNGQLVGQWEYGYSSFGFDLSPYIKFGRENVIAVRVDNPPKSSRWYPGGGIYRHTWLTKSDPVHVSHWGTYITTPIISKDNATVKIETSIDNLYNTDVIVNISHVIKEKNTGKVIAGSSSLECVVPMGTETKSCTQDITISNPNLWDIQNPNLYIAETRIAKDGFIVDTYQSTFGIRSIEWNPDKGFLLNGEIVKLNGVCLHHDLGPLGSAVHDRAIQRQIEIMQDMGVNSIRTSHNPPAPELIKYCDEMGIVVLDEMFDCWERGKTDNDYHKWFKDWYEKDITNLIKRDRNHPCVIAWSSGNEILEQWKGNHVSQMLTDLYHKLEPTRLVTAGCNSTSSYKTGFNETFDVYGFNYKPHLYAEFKQMHPNQPVYSSESASCISSRGEYYFPVSDVKSEGFFNFQVSSYDLYAPGWAMKPDIEFYGQDKYPFVAGEYVWTGFDYIGEPTPYNNDKTLLINYHTEEERKAIEEKLANIKGSPSRSSYFGIVDLCGFKKDRFYLYQARWRPQLPMAHILPHWNWPGREGEITPVHVYTSGDEAELFLNGKSLGKKKKAIIGQAESKEIMPISLSSKKTASASSVQEGNLVANGNDNNMKTRWCASSENKNEAWTTDLGSIQPVKSCVIYWEKQAGNYSYTVEVSNNESDWSVVAESKFKGKNNCSIHTFDTNARYLKVNINDLNDSTWASFYECQVFNTDKPDIYKVTSPEYYRLRWDDVKYQPGTLKAVAYKDGKVWATDTVSTTGEADAVKLSPDATTIKADGSDLCYITAEIIDSNGEMVPRTNNFVQFEISGPGEIIATGNGDATNPDCFKNTGRNAYNGMVLAIVRSIEGQKGTITVTAKSEGLKTDTVSFKAK